MVAKPHGGRLINRVAEHSRLERLKREAETMPRISITTEKAIEVENIANGIYSPLEGFMTLDDYQSTLDNMRLSNDIPWSIPIVLDVDEHEVKDLREGDDVILTQNGKSIALLEIEEIYSYDKIEFASKVFQTTDTAHPGVEKTLGMKDKLLGGKITLIGHVDNPYEKYTLNPLETRVLFKELGWRTIVAFQTRNAPHLGHEFLQKIALAMADGVFINPVIGRKKRGDFRDDVILAAYDTLIRNYYPKGSVVLSILRYEMRYAGPREAIHHAIMRKNFGCTHIIIGRDHAGVGKYYDPYAAQRIFDDFPDLGITPLFFREFFYCRKCANVVNERICPHDPGLRVTFSGTKLREMILKGERPPEEFMRPEVVDVIMSYSNPFVE